MKKSIWIAFGIAGMLLGNPVVDTMAAVRVNIGAGVTLGHRKGHDHRRHYHKKNRRYVAKKHYQNHQHGRHHHRNVRVRIH